MPPQHLLCAGLLGALLVREASADEDAAAADEASLAAERAAKKDEDSSEDEAEPADKRQRPPSPAATTAPAAGVDPELERSLERTLRESLDWAKALVAE